MKNYYHNAYDSYATYAFLFIIFYYFKTYLPYMKIVSERIFRGAELDGIGNGIVIGI